MRDISLIPALTPFHQCICLGGEKPPPKLLVEENLREALLELSPTNVAEPRILLFFLPFHYGSGGWVENNSEVEKTY